MSMIPCANLRALRHFCICVALLSGTLAGVGSGAEPAKVGERLFLWGHASAVYGETYSKLLKPSKIEPVAAADYMGLRNMYFIRWFGNPAIPFTDYYKSFQKLDRVFWSLIGAAGATSQDERDAAFELAKTNENLVGFIMDDFFQADPVTAQHWLALPKPEFPVVVTVTPPKPTVATKLTLAQTNWPSGNYRAGDAVIEVTYDSSQWQEVARTTIPNEAAAKVELELPAKAFSGIRARILGTHDKSEIASCGLSRFELSHDSKPIDCSNWTATSSSSNLSYPPTVLITEEVPLPASLSPEQLREIHKQMALKNRDLRLSVVVYTNQICPKIKFHLAQVDEITLWTWRPEDLEKLEENLTKLEKFADHKPIVLGCYMFDFFQGKPLSVDQMQRQIDLGYRWLQQGRIQGMIFLASPLCDLQFEAVEFTKKWIAEVKDQPLQHK